MSNLHTTFPSIPPPSWRVAPTPVKYYGGQFGKPPPNCAPRIPQSPVSLVVSAGGAAPHGARKVPRPALLPARLRPPPPRAVVARPWAARPLGGGQHPTLPARPAGGGCAPRDPLSAALRRHPRRPFLRPSVGPSAPFLGGGPCRCGGRGRRSRRLASLAADRPYYCYTMGGSSVVRSGWFRSSFALLLLFGSAPVRSAALIPDGGFRARLAAEILPCRKMYVSLQPNL